jgi:hypothetical protein
MALLLSAAELGGRVKQLQLFMQVLNEDYVAALQHPQRKPSQHRLRLAKQASGLTQLPAV